VLEAGISILGTVPKLYEKGGLHAADVHCAVTVVVTVTVRKGAIMGTTVLPAAVGIGADLRTIEKAPNGIVTPGKSPAASELGTASVTSDEAAGS
jgi:hypothetical protein